MKFDRVEWSQNKDFKRFKMYDDLKVILKGKLEKEVFQLLGDPDNSQSNNYHEHKNFSYTLNVGNGCGYGDHLALIIVFDEFNRVKIIDKECL